MLTKGKRGNAQVPAITNLLENFFDTEMANFLGSEFTSTVPAVNVKESNNAFKVELAAPGLKKEDFIITLENNVLNISAEQKRQEETESDTYRRREFTFSTFQRSFSLPTSVETDNIQAKYENGILVITVPKKETTINNISKNIKID